MLEGLPWIQRNPFYVSAHTWLEEGTLGQVASQWLTGLQFPVQCSRVLCSLHENRLRPLFKRVSNSHRTKQTLALHVAGSRLGFQADVAMLARVARATELQFSTEEANAT